MYPKKILVGALAGLVLLGGTLAPGEPLIGQAEPPENTSQEETTLPDGLKSYAQAGSLRLLADAATGTVWLEDTTSGRTWTSNPMDYREDPVARGANRTRLGAQLWLTYINEEQKQEETNSVVDCDPESGGIRLEAAEKGLRVVYAFEEAQVSLAVEYELHEEYLHVEIPFDSIRETGPNVLTGVTLLPNFGAAGAEENGYFILPDGCGALMRFNNQKYTAEEIRLSVYGEDGIYPPTSGTLDILPATLPMFAAVYADGSGFMAVATSSEAGSTIRASTGGKSSSFNTASFTFAYRAAQEVVFLDRTNAATSVYMSSPVSCQGTAFAVDYHMLHGEEASIAGTARSYRALLEAQGFERQNDLSFSSHLEVYSGVRKRKTFLGIPYTAYEPLTKWEDLASMADDFAALGSGVSVTLKGWNNNGAAAGKIDGGFRPAGSLGKRAQLTALLERDGMRIYPFAELNTYRKSGNGVYTLFDSVLGVDRKRLTKYTYSVVTGEREINGQTYALLRPDKVLTMGRKVMDAYLDNGIKGMALSGVGNLLYSDLSGQKTGIVYAQAQSTQLLREMAAELACLLDNPNAYAYPYASEIAGLPIRSNEFDMEDETIPFVQMVCQGYIRHYNVPLNLCGDLQKAWLFAVESGSMPSFALMQAEYEAIAHTELAELFACEYPQLKEDCARMTSELKKALDGLEGVAIRDYRIEENGVRTITYETGDVIQINYSDSEVTTPTTIPAVSYVRYREKEVAQ